MQEVLDSLYPHFNLIATVAVVWIVGSLAFRALRPHRSIPQRPPMPPITPESIRFKEESASGRSHKNWRTRLRIAHGSLVVAVTDSQLIVDTMKGFKWLVPPDFNDLQHVIPRSRIARVERMERFLRDGALIEFHTDDGTTRKIELYVSELDKFFAALGQPA